MISIGADTFLQFATGLMLVSLRIFGMFLSMPLFAFRAFPMTTRLMVALLLSIVIVPSLLPEVKSFGLGAPTYIAAGIELLIGVFIGFLIRIGLMAVELAAEILSIQTGLGFATNYVRDPAVASGLMGEFLGLTAMALMFVFNLHLLLIELLMMSFKSLPFGQWPSAWSLEAVLMLFSKAFQFGLVLAMPSIVVYLIFYVIQAILARTSPQFNLFSVGFAITVPMAFLVLALVLPDLPGFVTRIMQNPVDLIRSGLMP